MKKRTWIIRAGAIGAAMFALLAMNHPAGRRPTYALPYADEILPEENDFGWETAEAINHARYNAGLTPLSILPALNQAADQKLTGQTYGTDVQAFKAEEGETLTEIAASGVTTANMASSVFLSDGALDPELTHAGLAYRGISGTESEPTMEGLFYGPCETLTCELVNPEVLEHVESGTEWSDLHVILQITCKHGISYAPVCRFMVDGYDPNKTGKSEVTITYRNVSVYVPVWIEGTHSR